MILQRNPPPTGTAQNKCKTNENDKKHRETREEWSKRMSNRPAECRLVRMLKFIDNGYLLSCVIVNNENSSIELSENNDDELLKLAKKLLEYILSNKQSKNSNNNYNHGISDRNANIIVSNANDINNVFF